MKEQRVAAAQRDAASFGSGRELVVAVSAAIDLTLSRAAAEPEGRLVFTRWGEAMSLREYMKTRVFELVVHGIDLAMALDVSPLTRRRVGRRDVHCQGDGSCACQ